MFEFQPANHATYSLTDSTGPPSWQSGFMPHSGLVLPSARLFFEQDQLFLVFFDGEKVELLKWHEDKHHFGLVNISGREASLRALWKNSFSSNDVYWSYCLVKHAKWFLQNAPSATLSWPLDSGRLFTEWRGMQGLKD
jgi:hypothetical protein